MFLFYSLFFDTYHIYLCIFLHLSLSLATSSFLSPTLLYSIFFYVLLLVYHGITKLSLPSTSYPLAYTPFPLLTLNLLPLAIYHLFSTTLTTSLSFLLAIFIFAIISTSGPSITTSAKLQIYFSLINFWFSLSSSTPIFQPGLLSSPFTFPIFVSGTCFKVKLNLYRYNVQWACLLFNFCAFIKYFKFLWSI